MQEVAGSIPVGSTNLMVFMIKKIILASFLALTACGHIHTADEVTKDCTIAKNGFDRYKLCMDAHRQNAFENRDMTRLSEMFNIARYECTSGLNNSERYYSSCLRGESQLSNTTPKMSIWQSVKLAKSKREKVENGAMLDFIHNKSSVSSISQLNEVLPTPVRNNVKGQIIMPTFYHEVAPHKTLFGNQDKLESRKYFTSATFANAISGAVIHLGMEQGTRQDAQIAPYTTEAAEPGHYNLVSFSIGGQKQQYDASCGDISFDIKKNEVILLKGLKPLVVIHRPNSLGLKMRQAVLVEFSTLPPDHAVFLKRVYGLNPPYKIVGLKSNDAKKFNSCARSFSPVFKTLMDSQGAHALYTR